MSGPSPTASRPRPGASLHREALALFLLTVGLTTIACEGDVPEPAPQTVHMTLRAPPALERAVPESLFVRVRINGGEIVRASVNSDAQDTIMLDIPADQTSELVVYWYENYTFGDTTVELPLTVQRASVRAQGGSVNAEIDTEHEHDLDARIPASVVTEGSAFPGGVFTVCQALTAQSGDACSFDYDRDGTSNYDERRAGTNPIPVSVFTTQRDEFREFRDGGCLVASGDDPAPVAQGGYVVCASPFSIASRRVTPDELVPYLRERPSSVAPRLATTDGSAIGLSWSEANGFVRWLSERTGHSYRLPTEAELLLLRRDAGSAPDAAGGERRALVSVAGAVREWTCSDYKRDFDGSEQSCSGDHSVDESLGSKWPKTVVGANRSGLSPEDRRPDVGFRLVRD